MVKGCERPERTSKRCPTVKNITSAIVTGMHRIHIFKLKLKICGDVLTNNSRILHQQVFTPTSQPDQKNRLPSPVLPQVLPRAQYNCCAPKKIAKYPKLGVWKCCIETWCIARLQQLPLPLPPSESTTTYLGSRYGWHATLKSTILWDKDHIQSPQNGWWHPFISYEKSPCFWGLSLVLFFHIFRKPPTWITHFQKTIFGEYPSTFCWKSSVSQGPGIGDLTGMMKIFGALEGTTSSESDHPITTMLQEPTS